MSEYMHKDLLKSVIAGKGRADRIPMMYRFWIETNRFGEREKEVIDLLDAHPDDLPQIAAGQILLCAEGRACF